MLVPTQKMDDVAAIAREVASELKVGDPNGEVNLGPVVSDSQWRKIQALIQAGIDEGATLVAGGTGKPAGLEHGYYVKPTVFANVRNDMRIAREEIFGPVLAILGYDSVEQAIEIANDTEYGLAAYVFGSDQSQARRVASQLRAGRVSINDPPGDLMAPFGGFKQSGNGREWGDHAFAEFLETKAVIGYGAGA
jgi:aldehyde dehydrogenase (NAD+)